MLKFNIRASFTSRLVVGSLIALCLLSIPVALATHWVLRDQAIRSAGATAQAQTEQIAQSVDRHLKEHLRDLVYTSEIEQTHGSFSPQEQTELMNIMRRHTPGYLWIGVADLDGKVLAAVDNLLVGKNVAARPWFKKGLDGPAIMDVHEASLLAALLPERADEKYKFIDFTTPLKNQQGDIVAVIGIHLDWKYFISEIEQDVFSRINPTAPTVILAKDGSLRMGNRLDLADFQDNTAWKAMQGFQKAVAGERNWSIETLSDGNRYLIAFAPNNSPETSNLGWISATVTPLDGVSSAVSKALQGAVAALVVGTAATLLLVFALGRSLSAKARAYLDLVRRNDEPALKAAMEELPTELQPISKDILELTRSLSEQSRSLEAALKSTKESYWIVEALIVQAPIPIAMFDTQMNYVAASSRWSQAFVNNNSSLIGKNHYEVFPNIGERWRQAHQAGLAGESISATSDPWTTPAGKAMWLDWAIEPWLRPDGRRGGIIIMCKDVTEERLIRNSLAESEERFKLAMEGSHDGLWDWDVLTGKVYFSPSWKRLIGYEDHELQNELHTWERLTAPEDLALAKNRLQEAMADPSRNTYEAEFCMAHKQGFWVHILAKGLIVRNEQGEAVRVVGTHLDRTVQLELEGRLREAAISAKAEKESNAEKSRFLATMSHEIRTPLNGILGFAKLLEMDLPEGQLKEQAKDLVQSSESLSTILNDILDFSKIEAGMFKLNDAPFSLVHLLRGSTDLPRLTCESKGVKFDLRNDWSEHQIYLGDMGRLRQVLQNLLSNAIKFTSQGEVVLSVSGMALDGETDLLNFEVRDTGIGIPADKQSQLFKPFSQVHSDQENRYGGTGLGLSIVKSLVSAMGGEIQLFSEVGQGTQVVFSVRLKREREVSNRQDERIAPLCPMHVLVADDTPLNVKLLETFLKKDGHSVSIARDGEEALALALNEAFDFILLDIDMPKLSGYEVTTRIRATAGPNQNCEIAALTGYAFDSDLQKAEEVGINYHFAKPIQFSLLLNRLAISSRTIKA